MINCSFTLPDLPNDPCKYIDAGLLKIDATKITNPTIMRLLEEVRQEKEAGINSYNRFHKRHNRSK